ncbi:hypothetical protein [Prochlorococcus marinus]|uniref:Uncharacterized protein n=1 Tax=Prochlorococcus marinus XMU1408 TaxID=2213228 RepID=A0A318RHK3_PROMR|nr:hypothetical protein [Prochlorococcus marinus]MBW3042000.1 hypothetical protein [Prochlorococcus marinus str. XMU1408]PYE03123.1 hypothetical protein DNJ73_05130 [Prochlorococcus marinus XMU1408]
MRIESELCHLSEDKAIVKVSGWENEKNIGSALGEGSTVELAEDKAISRLKDRVSLSTKNKDITNINKSKDRNISNTNNSELSNNQITINQNQNQEPKDWSTDLAAIDQEIKRLRWSREDEIKYLQNELGYNNRNKITKYDELQNYLSKLKIIKNNNSSTSKIISSDNLIDESEIILKQLSWDHKKGREFLQREFNVSTRKELNEQQLISFVSKLKSIKNKLI